MRPVSVPLAASIAGHATGLTLLVLLAAQIPPVPLPQPKVMIEVALAAPEPPPPIPAPVAETPSPEPEPPPVAKAEPPPPIPEAEPPPAEPPPPPAAAAERQPPPPPPKRVIHKPPPPPRVVREIPPESPEPLYRQPVMPMMPVAPQQAPMQTAAIPVPQPQRAPAAPTGPVVSAGYRAALSAWLEGHKRYPDSARARSEEGRAVLRFRVDRSGRVLNYAVVQGTGYPDLDAAIDAMMRGASLPPFPADMTATDVEVSVTVRFALAR